MEAIRSFLSGLDARTKRILFLGGLALLLFVVFSVISPDEKKRRFHREEDVTQRLLTDEDPEALTVRRIASEMESLNNRFNKATAQLDALIAEERRQGNNQLDESVKRQLTAMRTEVLRLKKQLEDVDRNGGRVYVGPNGATEGVGGQVNTMVHTPGSPQMTPTMPFVPATPGNAPPVSSTGAPPKILSSTNNAGEVDSSNSNVQKRVTVDAAAKTNAIVPDTAPPRVYEGPVSATNEAINYFSRKEQERTAPPAYETSPGKKGPDNKQPARGNSAVTDQVVGTQRNQPRNAPASGNQRPGATNNATRNQAQNAGQAQSGAAQIRTIVAEAPKVTEPEKTEEEEKIEVGKNYIPAPSIIKGVLLSGLDAPTSQGTRDNPFPALMRVKGTAIMPNRHTVDLGECMIILSGWGSPSAVRAYLRGESISCITDDGKVIETRLDAWAQGEDGKAGVRGRLVSRQGKLLMNSLLAGFADGVAEAFKPTAIPSISIDDADGDNVKYQSMLAGDALTRGSLGGAQGALEKIADFYLKMAEETFPIIEIDAAREITLVLNKGLKLDAK